MATTRTTTRLIGILFITPFFFYGGGNALIDSVLTSSNTAHFLASLPADKFTFIIGAILMLLNSFNVAALGVLLLPIVQEHGKALGYGYFAGRLAEAVLLAVGVVALLCLVHLADGYSNHAPSGIISHETLAALLQKVNYWCFQTAMLALCTGSFGFCVVLWRTNLVSTTLAFMLLVGYVLLFVGAVFEMFGYNVGVMLSVPGGLCEIGFGAWLVVKGLNMP
ncbi:MAG: DUF4386 domain-containing protein [Candidatus Kapabacteria bacterium]|nr:DUF4386 domain-containing protein [Candidatus Kapabacteria bacterium]